MDKVPSQPQSAATEKPVASAKDAINARYAAKASSGAVSAPKTAASLHSHTASKRRMESVRPSASSLLHAHPSTKSSSTVVRTSLKLAPKRTPIVRDPRRSLNTANHVANALRPKKGQTRLAMDMMNRRPSSAARTASAVASIKAAAAAVTPTVPVSKTTSKPAPAAAGSSGRVFQDVMRPVTSHPAPSPARTAPEPSAPGATSATSTPASDAEAKPGLTLKSRQKTATEKAKLRPLDSLKNRFRPAPKGYAAADAKQASAMRPYRVEDFLNPTHSAATADDEPEDTAVHLYGLTEDAKPAATSPAASAESTATPAWAQPDSAAASSSQEADGLGIVEDYHPDPNAPSPAPAPADPVTIDKKASPDNNRYALGAQSPFFLKSVKVEKRPLSDATPLPRTSAGTPIYAGQSLEPTPEKNHYEKPTKKKTKAVAKPQTTVIIPSRPRSRVPLFGLLILTVILGAIAGAAIYLFLFQ